MSTHHSSSYTGMKLESPRETWASVLLGHRSRQQKTNPHAFNNHRQRLSKIQFHGLHLLQRLARKELYSHRCGTVPILTCTAYVSHVQSLLCVLVRVTIPSGTIRFTEKSSHIPCVSRCHALLHHQQTHSIPPLLTPL